MKRSAFILITIIQIVINKTYAQTFRIKSLQGNLASVSLCHQAASEKLLITSLHDTIRLDNFWSMDTVTIEGEVFLKIDYAVRVGSNNGSSNQLWLFIDHSQLKQALHINSFREYDYRPYEFSRFKVSTKLRGSTTKDYQLTLNINDVNQRSGRTLSKINKTDHLHFNTQKGCFCCDSIILKGRFAFRRIDGKAHNQSFLNQAVPVVNILKDQYYLINNKWYSRFNGTFKLMAPY